MTSRLPLKRSENSKFASPKDRARLGNRVLLVAAIACVLFVVPLVLYNYAEYRERLPETEAAYFTNPSAYSLPTPTEERLQVLATFGPFYLVVLVALAVGYYLVRWRTIKNQSARDSETRTEGPFVLILRPFFADRTIMLPSIPEYKGQSKYDREFVNFPEFVGHILEPYIAVRQVGRDLRSVGAATVYTIDAEWQAVVAENVARASAIILMPLLMRDAKIGVMRGTGSMWELRYLCEQGALEKVVMLMPFSHPFPFKSHRTAWDAVAREASTFGLHLPPYQRAGAVLTFHRSQGAWRVAKRYSPPDFSDVPRVFLDAVDGILLSRGVTLQERAPAD